MKENENIFDNEPLEENEPEHLESNEHKKIEVVTGDGKLTISPVYEHIEVQKPRPKDNRTVIIPEVKENFTTEEEKKEEN